MIEVFKTNVDDRHQAKRIINQIHQRFSAYQANFDLEDCDNILRVKSATGEVEASLLINLVQQFGYDAKILPGDDDILFHNTHPYAFPAGRN